MTLVNESFFYTVWLYELITNPQKNLSAIQVSRWISTSCDMWKVAKREDSFWDEIIRVQWEIFIIHNGILISLISYIATFIANIGKLKGSCWVRPHDRTTYINYGDPSNMVCRLESFWVWQIQNVKGKLGKKFSKVQTCCTGNKEGHWLNDRFHINLKHNLNSVFSK